MSVFIKDMKMPNNCMECPFAIREELIERIDSDSEKLTRIYNCRWKPEDVEDGWLTFSKASAIRQDWCPMKEVEEVPTIEPERKKGEWVGADSQCGIGCPFCGMPVDDFCGSIDYIDLRYKPNFCPNCGKDLRGEQNETD